MMTGSEAGPARSVLPGAAGDRVHPGDQVFPGHRVPPGGAAPSRPDAGAGPSGPDAAAGPGPAAGLLMAVAGVTLGVAAYLHRAGHIPLGFTEIRGENFYAASIPEAVIAFVLAAGAAVYLTASPAARAAAGRGQARRIALVATTFAVVGTAYGMSVTISDGRVADIVYHSCLMAILLIAGALLLRRHASAGRGEPA